MLKDVIHDYVTKQMMEIPKSNGKRKRKMSLTRTKSRRRSKVVQDPVFFAEPLASSNSFVGTEEYIAPVSCFPSP